MVIYIKKIKQGEREDEYLLSNSKKQTKNWIHLHKGIFRTLPNHLSLASWHLILA